jgi:Protein of unknown function (DUF2511)
MTGAEHRQASARTLCVVRLAAIIVILAGCSGSAPVATPVLGAVSRAQYGDAWPLTVESGVLRCEPGQAVVFRAPDGSDYGVNGPSLDDSYHHIEAIWAADPTGVSPKLSLGPLIQAGLALC